MKSSWTCCACGGCHSKIAGTFLLSRHGSARRVLIDSARKAKSEKRGQGWQRAPLDVELAWLGGETAESLDLSQALNDLAEFDPVKTRMVELHYFLGCTVEETAEILGVSTRTVERSLHFSLAWLHRRLR